MQPCLFRRIFGRLGRLSYWPGSYGAVYWRKNLAPSKWLSYRAIEFLRFSHTEGNFWLLTTSLHRSARLLRLIKHYSTSWTAWEALFSAEHHQCIHRRDTNTLSTRRSTRALNPAVRLAYVFKWSRRESNENRDMRAQKRGYVTDSTIAKRNDDFSLNNRTRTLTHIRVRNFVSNALWNYLSFE